MEGLMETNFSLRNVNIVKNDSKEAKAVKEADRNNFSDAVIDGTNTDQAELLKDVEGAMNSKDNVFIKTDKGIIKIDKEKVPEILAGLKEKLSKKDEFKVTGIGLDTGTNEFKVNFNTTPAGERTEAINDLSASYKKAVGEAGKDYNQEISNALKITDPEQRSAALQKAAEKFETFKKTADEGYIKGLKAANDKFLDTVKTKDPAHYPEIKKAADENINSRINSVNTYTNSFNQALRLRSDFLTDAANIKDPLKRKTAIAEANNDFASSIDKNRNSYYNSLETTDSKYSATVSNLLHPVNTADDQRKDSINEVTGNYKKAVGEAGKEYNQEIKDALKITNPEQRSAALEKAAAKFETMVKKADDVYIKDLKAANDKFLDTVKTKDPAHYPEIKKAADENINSRITAINSYTKDLGQELRIRSDFLADAANIKDPLKRKAALADTNTDFNNNIGKIREGYYSSIERTDSKYALDLNIVLSIK
jgi:hypothetical protein